MTTAVALLQLLGDAQYKGALRLEPFKSRCYDGLGFELYGCQPSLKLVYITANHGYDGTLLFFVLQLFLYLGSVFKFDAVATLCLWRGEVKPQKNTSELIES